MDELVKIALVGTAKHPQGYSQPDDDLLAAWRNEPPEGLLLLQAGVQAVVEQAGYEAAALPPPVGPAPPDDAPCGSPRLVGLLQNALAADSNELLKEFAGLMKSSGLRMPPELLPAVLDIQEPSLREAVLPLFGERGRWLSQFHPSWGWVSQGAGALSAADLGGLKRPWDEGNIATRSTVLARLRRMDIAEARNWLQAVFKQEKPEHRTRLLEQLAIGLDASDEPLLEEALADRSEGVRRTAANLLARLPGSQLAARMQDRADAMLNVSGTLRVPPGGTRSVPDTLPAIHCAPPTEIDAAWKRDGVPEQAAAGRGKRAVWVEAVLRAVPPGHWVRRFSADPTVLIEAVGEDDFAPAVLEGWTQAAVAFASETETAAWLAPLWNYWLPLAAKASGAKANAARQHVSELLQAMPAAEAEACLQAQMAAGDEAELLVAELVALLPRPWSPGFARSYLQHTIGVLQRPGENATYRWSCTLSHAARAMPPQCFREALQMAEQALAGPKSGHYTERELDACIEVIRLRESFYQEVPA
jgi:hypothetical protein